MEAADYKCFMEDENN